MEPTGVLNDGSAPRHGHRQKQRVQSRIVEPLSDVSTCRENESRFVVMDRVELLGYVSDQDLLELYAHCRASLYAPLNEDYGYVTVESFLSRKPVITSTDSGGPLEFVEDGVNGVVTAPEPEALAGAIDRLFSLPETRLRDMGEEGRRRVAHITWDAVVDRLTESIR